jgi:hypothetical protein
LQYYIDDALLCVSPKLALLCSLFEICLLSGVLVGGLICWGFKIILFLFLKKARYIRIKRIIRTHMKYGLNMKNVFDILKLHPAITSFGMVLLGTSSFMLKSKLGLFIISKLTVNGHP